MSDSMAMPPTGGESAQSARDDELLRLAAHLQRVRENERAAIARQLHDELGGLFTAAKLDATRLRMRLESAQGPPAPGSGPDGGTRAGTVDADVAARLSHLIELLNAGVQFKRRLIETLMPSSLVHLGLVPALELLIDAQRDAPSLELDHALAPVELAPPVRLTAYRAAEEGLANVRRHARAARVQVELRADGDHAVLEVADDGQGFDLARPAPDGYGLLALRYRVQADGGTMSILSRPGQGTRLSIRLPLEKAQVSGFQQGPVEDPGR
ncbi:MAG: histidine kinase [Burkholderiaceae bacterium]